MGSGKDGQQQGRRNHPHEGATAHPQQFGARHGVVADLLQQGASQRQQHACGTRSQRARQAPLQLGLPPQPARPTPAAHPLPKQQGGDHRRSQPQHHQANKASRRRDGGPTAGEEFALGALCFMTKTRISQSSSGAPTGPSWRRSGSAQARTGSGSAAADRWPPATGRRGWAQQPLGQFSDPSSRTHGGAASR